MKKNTYLNFMGTPGNYKFYQAMPNPDNLRGNPDTFSWAMNKGGDGLNASRIGSDYSHFTGEVQDDNWNYGKFYNQDGEDDIPTDMNDVVVDGNADDEPKWWQIGQWEIWNSNNLTDEQKDERRQNFWNTATTFLDSFNQGYQQYQASNNPMGQQYGPLNMPPNTTTTTTPGNTTTTIVKEGNVGGGDGNKTLLYVLGGLGVVGIIVALVATGRQAPRRR